MMSLSVYAREPVEVAAAFAVDPQRGLAAGEAVRRSIHYGRNVLRGRGHWPLLSALVSLLLPARPNLTRVLCNGEETLVNAADLVPGDVIVVESGVDVPADARVVSASALVVDESHLTGVTMPVSKSIDAVAADAPLPGRHSMVYLGTHVVAGHATAIVTATGEETELAKLSNAVQPEESCRSDQISTSSPPTAGTSSARYGSSPASSSLPRRRSRSSSTPASSCS
jgi:magnesium-transporting ATPase (P-type)